MYPHSEAAGRSLLALPFHHNITADVIESVCDVIAEEAFACRDLRIARARS